MFGNPESFRIVMSKDEKVKEKARPKVDPKELVTHTLVKNKHKTIIGGQKKTVFGGPRVRKARKAFRKERTNFLKAILVLFKTKIQTRSSSPTKERVKIRVEEEEKVFCLRIAK